LHRISPRERSPRGVGKKALLRLEADQTQERFTYILGGGASIYILCSVSGWCGILHPDAGSDRSTYIKEPLIEAAARAQLRKTHDEPLTAEELKTVRRTLYLGTEISATREPFDNAQVDSDRFTRGDIASLEDLALMPNIEELQISYQDLDDLTGISALKNPVSINLMYTQIADIAELAGKQSLLSLNLYETNVTDVSCLATCRRLSTWSWGIRS
jgi:hypothetical protein